MSNNVNFAYARHALVAALRHLNARQGDFVAIPEFICRDILASLHHIGVLPRFYPVGRDLRPLDSSIEESIHFVLMVNYFGFPQSVSEFRSKWPNAQIIEDNAHGYLSRDENGIELGTRTEAGITSCRKTILAPDGAILHISSRSDNHLNDVVESRNPRIGFTIRATSSRLERSTGIPVNYVLRTILRAMRKARTGVALPRPDSRAEVELPNHIHISRRALKTLQKVDIEREIQRRRKLFQDCLDVASRNGVDAIFDQLPTGCAPYGFPFIAHGRVAALERFARRQHCEVIEWPDLPDAISVPADHFYRNTQVVNFL